MFVGTTEQLINALEAMPIRGGIAGQHVAFAAAGTIIQQGSAIDNLRAEITQLRAELASAEGRFNELEVLDRAIIEDMRAELEREREMADRVNSSDALALGEELIATMSRYDSDSLPDDENGMAASVNLGPEYVRKIIDALRSRNPTVVPLVWENFGLEMWAESIIGKYSITGHGGRWCWAFDDDDPYHHGEEVYSEEEAKSAAQSHFEAVVLSALAAHATRRNK